MNLISIPALQDNYIWLLVDAKGHCFIIDPGTAAPVLALLSRRGWAPTAILLTHHHQDHVGGVAALRLHFPHLPVYGPQETASKGATQVLEAGKTLLIDDHLFSIIATPGHTHGHVSYYHPPYLFCGDTLFSAGCGRIFEGTTAQMYASLQRLAKLPDNTLICCGHNYTLANLAFAHTILPQDKNIQTYQQQVARLCQQQPDSLPSSLALERKINLFLRCHDAAIKNKLAMTVDTDELTIFTRLRAAKDRF